MIARYIGGWICFGAIALVAGLVAVVGWWAAILFLLALLALVAVVAIFIARLRNGWYDRPVRMPTIDELLDPE